MPLTAVPAGDDVWPDIAGIFHASRVRNKMESGRESESQLERWMEYYRSTEPELFFLARRATNRRIVGYLTGSRDSFAARRLGLDVPPGALFDAWVRRFPAHLHVNCHPDWRGFGIGRRLISRLCCVLRANSITGVHVITAFGARNVAFYRHCGFRIIAIGEFDGRQLVLLGRRP